MKIILHVILFLFLMVSCQTDEINLVVNNIEFRLTSPTSSIERNKTMNVTIERLGNISFDTQVNVYFYLSTDSSYSADDILTLTTSATFTETQPLVNFSLVFGNAVSTDDYYLIARLTPQQTSSSSSERIYKSLLKITQPISLITINTTSFTGITTGADNITKLYNGDNISLNIKYTSNLSSSTYLNIDIYLSKDQIINPQTDTRINAYYQNNYIYANQSSSFLSYLTIPNDISGTYYMIIQGSYIDNNNSYIEAATIIKPVYITSIEDLITISGLDFDADTALYGQIVNPTFQINNGINRAINANVYMYLSTDQTYSYDDYTIGNKYGQDFNSGITIVTVTSNISTSATYQECYLIASINYYIGGNYKNIYIASEKITIKQPKVSISAIRLDSASIHKASGLGIHTNLTITSNLNSYYNNNLVIYSYLSTDKTWSSDDLFSGLNYFNYNFGNTGSDTYFSIPINTSNNNYFLILRYTKPGSTDYTYLACDDIIKVTSPSAVLYRNTYNASYSDLYLFIDDVYVQTLNSYDNYGYYTSCSFFFDNSGDTLKSFYKYYSSSSATAHTFQLRTTNDLSTGTTIRQGTFDTSETGCTLIDVD